jgi:hypothetical protein
VSAQRPPGRDPEAEAKLAIALEGAASIVTHASARGTDPPTSREAAHSLDPRSLSRGQRIVLNVFQLARRPLMDHELIAEVRRNFGNVMSDSGVRSRRRELQRKGAIAVIGYGTSRSGRACQKFALWGGGRG